MTDFFNIAKQIASSYVPKPAEKDLVFLDSELMAVYSALFGVWDIIDGRGFMCVGGFKSLADAKEHYTLNMSSRGRTCS